LRKVSRASVIWFNIKWKFQREWRYRLTLCPIDFDKPYNEMQKEYTIMANKLRDGFDVQSVPYYDMKLDDHAFQNMEIVMSPRLNEANRTILNCLVDRFNPSAKIVDSLLKGLI
jgi:hypothetical protein